jgi:hypothetical protein
MEFRKKIDAVKAIPGQVQFTLALAMSALIVAVIALAMSGGRRRAN